MKANMNKRNDMIVQWVVDKIKKDFKDDVSLLLTYGSYEDGTSNPLSDVDFYFIPNTENAYKLCKTFIVEGIGYDLFPMSWKRVEGLAELNECLIPCLANVKILYSHSEEDNFRFKELQKRLKNNLNNKNFMLDKSAKQLEMAMTFYQTMLFEEDICEIRTLAGKIVMSLSDTVAYANQTYFSRGLKKQLEDLKNMESIPIDFLLLYESVIKATSVREIKDCCHEMIKHTRNFLISKTEKSKGEQKKANYEALAEIYEEGISTWNKIKVCCDNGNAILAYISGTCLQDTLNMAARENGLDKIDLMSAYNAEHLGQFNERALEIQRKFVKMIEENGVIIESYNSVEAFIKEN